MIVRAPQTASREETSGAERPNAQNGYTRSPSQPAQQPVPEVRTQVGPPSPPQPPQLALAYHVDAKTKQIYFQIVDSQSGQVIRQIPPAEQLALEGRIAELMEAAANAKQPKSQEGGR